MEQKKYQQNVTKMSDLRVKDQQISTAQDDASLLIDRLNCLNSIKMLCKLTKVIQKHRGASISCINGDTGFLALREDLEGQADRLFMLLLRQQNIHGAIPQVRLLASLNDWQSIKLGWQKDTVILNYEFHSHLVDALNRIARECVRETCADIEETNTVEGIHAILIDVPENIELLAKMRGLATHIAVSGYMDEDSRLRIAFLCERITRDYKRLYHALNALGGTMTAVQALHALPRQKSRLEQLLQQVNDGILTSHGVTAKGNQLFELATEIIDVYWLIVEQGLHVVEECQFRHYIKD